MCRQTGHIHEQTPEDRSYGTARPSHRPRPGENTQQPTTTKDQKMGKSAACLRYSTDRQNETSLEDQLRKCRELAALDKNTIDDEWTFADKAITGQASGT